MDRDDGLNGNRNNNNNGRLFLNFGNNDRFPPNDRAYPTTPSTFPQPVFPPQNQAQQQYAQPQQFQSSNTATATQPGYFMNNPYPPQYPQQPSAAYQSGQAAPQAAYAPRQGLASNNDATNGLVHQFSHQNLGGSGRNSPANLRQAPTSSRPRTAGASSQSSQSSYSNYLNNPMPNLPPQQQLPDFGPAPERNPEKYGAVTHNNQKRCAQLAADFFKDSVKRARDRNVR